MLPAKLIINKNQTGQRLDYTLAQIFSGLSLRARRRLWDNWHILVDNKHQGPGHMVHAGQIIRIEPKNTITCDQSINNADKTDQPRILAKDNGLIFIYKPRGLHSQHLAHGGPSLEALLPTLMGTENAILCNRLDAQTSGIVVVAKQDEARQKWQELENAGHCQKHYIALVQGEAKSCTMTLALQTDKRKKSRILKDNAPPLRHTHFQVLNRVDTLTYAKLREYFQSFPEHAPAELYFVACTIYKGSRHQIRAHAAHAGFALFNDHRYNTENPSYSNECFLLHHGALVLPHVRIDCPAPWNEQVKIL